MLLAASSATGQWIGPLKDAYDLACMDVANEGPFDPSIALDRCQQLCTANLKCNAMNYGNPPPNVGCSLRNYPNQSAHSHIRREVCSRKCMRTTATPVVSKVSVAHHVSQWCYEAPSLIIW